MSKPTTPAVASALLVSAVFCAPLAAQELTGTLKKIKDSGTILLGHRESSVPFSYYDDKKQVVGYSQDLMLKVVEAIKADLKLDKLETKLVAVNPSNRTTMLDKGMIDIECGSTTNNSERQKLVSFSNTIFTIGTRLMTKTDSGVKDFPDLAGKSVVTTAGTTSERMLRKMNDEKQMKMTIVSAKDNGEALLTLETGRAAAFMMDDALLYGEIAKAKNAKDWTVVGKPQSAEAYGCMLRKDDAPIKKIADAALAKAMTSGEAEKIYHKWFQQPIPPNGLNLAFPLSDGMKALYKAPNDKAFD